MLYYKYSDEGAISIENIKFLILSVLYIMFNVLQTSYQLLYKAENFKINDTAILS